MTNANVQYYVEGEDERKLINVLKTDLQMIIPGKVDVFNAICQNITKARLISMKPKTIVVLVFDTDVGNKDILLRNIDAFKKCKNVIDVILIPQNKNLEDELVRSCNIKEAKELLGSQGKHKFKSDFIKASNLPSKLKEKGFNIKKLWGSDGTGSFMGIKNGSNKIMFK